MLDVYRRAKVMGVAMVASLAMAGVSWAGPYSQHSNNPGNPFDAPIAAGDPRLTAWASAVFDFAPAPGVGAGFDDPANALGPWDGVTASLGDLFEVGVNEPPDDGTSLLFDDRDPWNGDPNDLGDDYGFLGIDPVGTIIVGFTSPITNRPGPDFAVFENGFSHDFADNPDHLSWIFAELGYVEVSTDGSSFARFAAESAHLESELDTQFGRSFAALAPTGVYNLAGKHIGVRGGWGTPFDLDDLTSDQLVSGGQVDLNQINFVRIVDIVGNGAQLDSNANPIFDTWVGINTGGFDLDAIGVLPEPATLAMCALGVMGCARRRR